MVSKQIELQIKKEIVNEINALVSRYNKQGAKLSDLKNYFKKDTSIKTLINDINEVGRRHFENNEQYTEYVKKVVKDVINDRITAEEMNIQENMNTIRKYSQFEYTKESIDTDEISSEYLFNDIGYANDDMDILAGFFNTNKEFIEVVSREYCVYTITDFKSDITRNNRTRTNILLLSDIQVGRMKENVNKRILTGIYNQIPTEVQYMGIQVSPHSVLDKQKIKDAISEIVDKNIIDIISKVTKYDFVDKYNETYFIWKKEK